MLQKMFTKVGSLAKTGRTLNHFKLLPKAQFHSTPALAELCCKTPCTQNECPITREGKCKPLKIHPCSPTDPPVRPCAEDPCLATPRYPCCINANIAANPCNEPDKRKEFVSMWEKVKDEDDRPKHLWTYKPECCPKCEDARFDELYYRPSDKCRTYQRTWWECCPRMVPKRVCCWCDAVPPEVDRRCLPLCPRSACSSEDEKKRLACLNRKSKGCLRVAMPCCRPGRVPPNCHRVRKKTKCQKIKCPFPSFSECIREDLATLPERPHECRCLQGTSLCTALRVANYYREFSIPIYPGCPGKSCT